MELTQSVFVLKLYAAVIAVLLVAEVHAQPHKFSTDIQQTGDESSTDLNLLKMALREAYNRELEFYEQQEAQIAKQLAALENDRNQIRERKRSHIRCLVNVIACYRKK